MVIVNKNYGGHLAYCNNCRTLLGWKIIDVYGSVIYCPVCKNAIEVSIDKSYDGVVKEGEK